MGRALPVLFPFYQPATKPKLKPMQKKRKIGFVHTSATLVPGFQQLFKEQFKNSEVSYFNMVDDSLIKEVIQEDGLTPAISRRVVNQVAAAQAAGADLIMVTCSSIGPAVELAAGLMDVPVLRVDQPMVDEAIKMGKRIGVIATLTTTLGPTSDLLKRRSIQLGKEIEIKNRLCKGAFEHLMSGNQEAHDKAVRNALMELQEGVDVIILAQASMARVVDLLSDSEKKIPILSSPSLAVKHLHKLCS